MKVEVLDQPIKGEVYTVKVNSLKFSLSCGFLVDWICLFYVLLLMQQFRGRKLNENEQKSKQPQKENSFYDDVIQWREK